MGGFGVLSVNIVDSGTIAFTFVFFLHMLNLYGLVAIEAINCTQG